MSHQSRPSTRGAGRAGFAAWCFTLVIAAVAPAAELEFVERSESWGLNFQHHHGGSGARYMVETMIGGVVIFDYDLDGDDDVLWVDGGILPGYEGAPAKTTLHRNDGGRFVDVTEQANLIFAGYGCGAVAGDIDGDGDLDVLVTAFGDNALFVNQGDGTFAEETESRGLKDPLWSTSAAFADADLDGDLDLYVGSYVDFSLDNHKQCGKPEEGIIGYCHPDSYEGEPDRFYLNKGDGTFEEVTKAAGLETAREATLGVVFADLDGDGLPDLYLANDLDPNQMFRNLGGGKFEDQSLLSGAGYSLAGKPEAGMGVDLADLDGDGKDDLVVTNFALESNAYYRNQGFGLFIDSRYPARLAEASLQSLGFGLVAADFDHDGDQDLVIANGHVLDNAEQLSAVKDYAQRNQLMRNDGGVFDEVTDAGLDVVRVSRGLAVSDLDLDGDLDVVVINSNQLSEVYENVGADGVPSVQVRLLGPNAVGSKLQLTVSAPSQSSAEAGSEQSVFRRLMKTGGSYLSQNTAVAHFGLGPLLPQSLTVSRPGNSRLLRIEAPPVGRTLVIGPVGPLDQ